MELVFHRLRLLELFIGRLVGQADVFPQIGVFLAKRGEIVLCDFQGSSGNFKTFS